MELLIVTIAIIGYFGYKQYLDKDEKIKLIRELTLSLKSTSVIEYKELIPEDDDNKIEVIEDELVPIESIEPEVLLRALK